MNRDHFTDQDLSLRAFINESWILYGSINAFYMQFYIAFYSKKVICSLQEVLILPERFGLVDQDSTYARPSETHPYPNPSQRNDESRRIKTGTSRLQIAERKPGAAATYRRDVRGRGFLHGNHRTAVGLRLQPRIRPLQPHVKERKKDRDCEIAGAGVGRKGRENGRFMNLRSSVPR